jgi:hypothetical protein
VAGSRTIRDPRVVARAIAASGFDVTVLVSGGAQGVDRLGEEWARDRYVHVERWPADWAKHGKAAGPIRNEAMAAAAHALVAVWDGVSRGTAHMVRAARARGLQVYVHNVAVVDATRPAKRLTGKVSP